jgi:hypothetical protein
MDMHFLLLVSSLMQHLLLLLMSGLLILEHFVMVRDKAIFSTLNECNTKQIFVGDDRSLRVVGSGII